MKKSLIITFVLLGIFVLIGAITAARMIAIGSYLNSATQYARAHATELSIPQPVAGAKISNPLLRVATDAYYGDAVEVQITRRYQSAKNLEQDFAVTYFYQPNGADWKVIAPPTAYWGETKTSYGEAVTVIHPQRNLKLVTNLITVIDPALTRACQRWSCAATPPLTITFVTDPATPLAPLTFLAPQYTGVPMSKQANEDYFSQLTSETLIALVEKLSFDSPYARAFAYREIEKQNLYAAIPNFKNVANATVPRPSEVWAINANRSDLADGVALSFLNFAMSQSSLTEAEAFKAFAVSSSFNEWIVKAKLGDPAALETAWLKTQLVNTK